jgi:hypothetical protein
MTHRQALAATSLDEEWFLLYGHISSHNNQYRSSVNPYLIHQVPLHEVK